MEEHLMINNTNLVCMMTLTLKSDREGKCLLFYHTLTVHIYLTLYLIQYVFLKKPKNHTESNTGYYMYMVIKIINEM
jgi:hypothetical protein